MPRSKKLQSSKVFAFELAKYAVSGNTDNPQLTQLCPSEQYNHNLIYILLLYSY